jgi:lysophospholipase L1-like esterase
VTAATPVVVSLGDSFASGEGVGLRTPSDVTWAGLVAAAAGARFVALARGGAPAGAVLRDQVPMALALDPDVVCVCVGLNDLFRSGGTRGDDDPGVVLVDLGALVERPECWAPDRVHPSDYGHRVLAAEAARRLALPHAKVGLAPAAPTAAASWRWFARHGVPWLAQRLPELATSEPLRRRVLQAGAKTAV